MNDVKHLILLVGTNPLPNYVVAKYFLEKSESLEKIWFVHSAGCSKKDQSSTKDYVDNIIEVLKVNVHGLDEKDLFEYVSLSDIEDVSIISNKLQEKFENNLNGRIHLNYTGGTKMMGIHTYLYLKELENISQEFSYLSPRKFKLVDDYSATTSKDLRKVVKLNFEDLIKLHGYVRINENIEFLFKDALEIFEELIENDQLENYYDSDGGYFRDYFLNSKGELIEKTKDLNVNEYLKRFVARNSFLKINNALPDDTRIFNESGKLKDELPTNKNVEHTIKFFSGDWLERYIYKIINKEILNKDKSNFSIYNNWVIKKPKWKNLDFEIDVIIMQGYQFFGISCTTDKSKGKCKEKGFEVILRTKQIGGDESKAILVTLTKEETKLKLQNELEIETGGSSKNILVLGRNDLKKDILTKRIVNFINI